ncbi:MAG: hypothetical protein LLG14_08845 [Nocardiaceae bacterium]|nr:hypothetical protein [Nocardiaceae bacterium]
MKSIWSAHRPLVAFAAAMGVLVVVSVIGLFVDDRSLVGAPLWAKPFKFALSFTIYGITWAWLLSLQTRWKRLGWWLGTVITTAGVIEMIVIVGQQVRLHRSHFNVATPVDAALWSTMGATIAVLFIANVVWTVLLWRQPLLEAATSLALRLGATISLAGLAVAFLMTSPTAAQLEEAKRGTATIMGAHSVGVEDGGPGLPLLGWSTTGGDLRIPHFVGMHALQIVPLACLAGFALLGRLGITRALSKMVLVCSVALGYFGILSVITVQALRGQPVVRPDAMTLGQLAIVVVIVLAGVMTAVVTGFPTRVSSPSSAGQPKTVPAA